MPGHDHDGIEQCINQWINETAKLLQDLSSVDKELMDALHGLSEEAAIKLCEQFIGVENGTLTIMDEIIPCIKYDAAIRALDLSPKGTLSISVYYQSHLQTCVNMAWGYVCNSLSSDTDNMTMASALMLLGTTKRKRDSLVDHLQFFRCRTFCQLYNLLREFGDFLNETWNNNNAAHGERIRGERIRENMKSKRLIAHGRQVQLF